jgi:hypothetical protein
MDEARRKKSTGNRGVTLEILIDTERLGRTRVVDLVVADGLVDARLGVVGDLLLLQTRRGSERRGQLRDLAQGRKEDRRTKKFVFPASEIISIKSKGFLAL